MDRRHSRGGLVLVILIALIVVAGAGALHLTKKDTTIVPPDETVCDCEHLQQMLDRQWLANAAIESIDKEIAKQSARNSQEMYSDALYDDGRKVNQARVSNATEGHEPTGAAHTPPANCKPDVSRGRGVCMKAALLAHENVHQRECLKVNTRLGNYKNSKTMVAYWEEDREGYQEEIKFLDRQISRVTRKCSKVSTYLGPESKEDQQQRLAGSRRRVSNYVAGLS